VERDGRYLLALDDASLEVDPALGGRVTALRASGRDLLTGTDLDAGNFGSTFWTSPQSQWGWPPVPEIDHAPYRVAVDGGVIVMHGEVSPALGVAVEKRFSADGERGCFALTYGIVNHGAAPVQMAPWEITRLRTGGLTFFPTGAGWYPPSNLAVRDDGEITWFAYDATVITDHQKLFADAKEGWIAHVDGDAILVKTFAVVARERQAPGEALVELYATPALTYIEVEEQGPFETIPPGGTLPWRVDWYVRQLPAGLVGAASGSAALVAFVRALVSGA
jgi:hypothetical protein